MSLLRGLFGTSTSHLNPSPAALANNPHSQASMSMSQLAQHAQQQFNNAYNGGAYNAYAQQNNQTHHQAAAQQQAMWNAAHEQKQFRINGRDMDFDEFIDALFPEECAERTYLILKLKGNENGTKSD